MKILRIIFTGIFILPVKIYQLIISPFFPASCRHVPTCSQYAIEAIKLHGPLKGTWFAIRRILRCNPWGTSGFDPVPPKGTSFFKLKNYKPKKNA